MDLVFFLTRKVGDQKMAQTEFVRKNTKWLRSEAND